ncbi:MAG: YchJ family protein [Gammaproteobacteria bacterium]|nr:YchJ family protein [Gammaproteobacteria bacterium]
MTHDTDNLICPCCSGKSYIECCKPLHDNQQLAETAEQLMRSRYCAFVLNLNEYILSSWDKTTRPESIDLNNQDIEWTKLEIIETKKGKATDRKGVVQFKAYHLINDKPLVLNEISQFVKKSSRWYYLKGVIKSVQNPSAQTSPGKNAPCACGSGKKFKRCCSKS